MDGGPGGRRGDVEEGSFEEFVAEEELVAALLEVGGDGGIGDAFLEQVGADGDAPALADEAPLVVGERYVEGGFVGFVRDGVGIRNGGGVDEAEDPVLLDFGAGAGLLRFWIVTVKEDGARVDGEFEPVGKSFGGQGRGAPTGQASAGLGVLDVVVAEDFDADGGGIEADGVDAALGEWAHPPELVFVDEEVGGGGPALVDFVEVAEVGQVLGKEAIGTLGEGGCAAVVQGDGGGPSGRLDGGKVFRKGGRSPDATGVFKAHGIVDTTILGLRQGRYELDS